MSAIQFNRFFSIQSFASWLSKYLALPVQPDFLLNRDPMNKKV